MLVFGLHIDKITFWTHNLVKNRIFTQVFDWSINSNKISLHIKHWESLFKFDLLFKIVLENLSKLNFKHIVSMTIVFVKDFFVRLTYYFSSRNNDVRVGKTLLKHICILRLKYIFHFDGFTKRHFSVRKVFDGVLKPLKCWTQHAVFHLNQVSFKLFDLLCHICGVNWFSTLGLMIISRHCGEFLIRNFKSLNVIKSQISLSRVTDRYLRLETQNWVTIVCFDCLNQKCSVKNVFHYKIVYQMI